MLWVEVQVKNSGEAFEIFKIFDNKGDLIICKTYAVHFMFFIDFKMK